MLSMLKEALEWRNRAGEAREVAGQLTDPGARKAVLELAQSFDRLARAAATPAVHRRRTVEAQIDSLLREKEEIEKWAAVGSA